MAEKKISDQMVEFVRSLQTKICSGLESLETEAKFKEIEWKRPGGGGGQSRILEGGEVFEKGGVNISIVHGELTEVMMKRFQSDEKNFFATGISLVIHPRNPNIPTVHANWRYFEQPHRAWFGGGADLTPYTWDEESFRHFHRALKRACDTYRPTAYAEFKKECDEYFYLPHRGETRGIGGIFFDYIQDDLNRTFAFVEASGSGFLEAYSPIVKKNWQKSFTDRQKKFQLLRRGRYVEFNLIYDRGTLFGLQTKGNTESILMSLPPHADWDYGAEMETTDEERRLMKIFRQPSEWA